MKIENVDIVLQYVGVIGKQKSSCECEFIN